MLSDDQDRVQLAREGFAGPLNCAQAIAAAFQDLSGLTPEQVADHGRNGGGRAPGGICGALHAALEALHDDAQRKEMITRFTKATGSALCREIRGAKQVSCADCVEAAATLLAHALDDKTGDPSDIGRKLTQDSLSGPASQGE